MPLASSFILSKKKGKEAWIEPVIEANGYQFTVKIGSPSESAVLGTSAGKRNAFRCLLSGVPVTYDHIRSEGQAGRMGARLMAIVAEGERGRVYLTPPPAHERVAQGAASPLWRPEGDVPSRLTGGTCVPYGIDQWWKLFTNRQLVSLTTLTELVADARKEIRRDAVAAGLPDDGAPLRDAGEGATAYAEAAATLLAFAVSKTADSGCTVARWQSTGDFIAGAFGRQAIPMVWDFAEANVFSSSTQNWLAQVEWMARSVLSLPSSPIPGEAFQADAASDRVAPPGTAPVHVVSTDPPYYDNIGYADLSDFFYVWLRRTLRETFPDLFATLAVPKDEELVATPYRHGSRQNAKAFFLNGMTQAMRKLAEGPSFVFPVTIYYAFKQAETTRDGVTSGGWETFLSAVIEAGLTVTATWPMRTERPGRPLAIGTNSLASSIVLACRPRSADAQSVTRREYQEALRAEFPEALSHLQRSNIAPVDLAQASIGPGMAVFTRYRDVLNADGSKMSVGEALGLINATLDEVLDEQEGDFDADSRWASTWFEQYGYGEGEYGAAEQLSKAKATSVEGLVRAGIIDSRRGKVCILRPEALDPAWDPSIDSRLTVWGGDPAPHPPARVGRRAGGGGSRSEACQPGRVRS